MFRFPTPTISFPFLILFTGGAIVNEIDGAQFFLRFEIKAFDENIHMFSTEPIKNETKTKTKIPLWVHVPSSALTNVMVSQFFDESGPYFISDTRFYIPPWLQQQQALQTSLTSQDRIEVNIFGGDMEMSDDEIDSNHNEATNYLSITMDIEPAANAQKKEFTVNDVDDAPAVEKADRHASAHENDSCLHISTAHSDPEHNLFCKLNFATSREGKASSSEMSTSSSEESELRSSSLFGSVEDNAGEISRAEPTAVLKIGARWRESTRIESVETDSVFGTTFSLIEFDRTFDIATDDGQHASPIHGGSISFHNAIDESSSLNESGSFKESSEREESMDELTASLGLLSTGTNSIAEEPSDAHLPTKNDFKLMKSYADDTAEDFYETSMFKESMARSS